tara:strand:- start:506 stop:811 length:306 start_codon:yes stop_codon:yes gene_type:complete
MADIRMNEASNKEVKNMTDMIVKYKIWSKGDYNISKSAFRALAIVRYNMTDEAFLVLWAETYPQHMMGGYAQEQLHIWKTNPFDFVAKWPDFAHHLVKTYN